MNEEARAAVVELLWRDPRARSRNRNFDRFRDSESAHARRVVLYLLMLTEEIEGLPEGAVHARRGQFPRGTVRLAYRRGALGLGRVAFLTEHELSLLSESAAVRRRLTWESDEIMVRTA